MTLKFSRKFRVYLNLNMKLSKFTFPTITIFLVLVLLASCGAPPAMPSASEVETVVALTFAALTESAPTSTREAEPSVGESPTAEITPPESPTILFVQTTAQNVNLRVGPGTLFQVSRVLAQGTTLEAHGQSRDGEWLYVKNDEEVFGWVLIQLLQVGGHDGPPLSFVEPENAILVTGIVKTEAGTPVNGIGFAITKGFDLNAPRTDATTDKDGRFYAYLPSTSTGAWNVGYVSVACTSITMDVNCNCKSGTCGRAYPETVQITLPFNGELAFIWK